MSSAEALGGTHTHTPGFASVAESREARLQEAVDIIVDFMGVAAALWERGERKVPLELAAYASVALDEVIEVSGLPEYLAAGRITRLPHSILDFRVLLYTLGGEALGDVIYWAAEALSLRSIPEEALLLIKDFADYVGIPHREDTPPETLAATVLQYIVASFNKAVASMVAEGA